MFVKEGEAWSELINNDGIHATRMGCPYRTIEMKKDSEVPLKILYYQGPRYHLANVLMWKWHKKAKDWKRPSHHSLCGVAGGNFYFNTGDDRKTLAMRYLEKTGWNVLAAKNYKMPDRKTNPCSEELAISNFKVVSVQAPNATLSWQTSVPATGQLRIMSVYTGEEIITQLDENLVNEHSVNIKGLESGFFYQIQAISKDANGNEVRSAVIDLIP